MDTDLSGDPEKDAKFWESSLEAVHDQGVRPPYERWYLIRAEQYLKRHPNTSPEQAIGVGKG
jgi:hypothetical protein